MTIPTPATLDGKLYGQKYDDAAGVTWIRINHSGPAQWQSIYGTFSSARVLDSHGFGGWGDVRPSDVVVDAPPVQRMPAVETSVA